MTIKFKYGSTPENLSIWRIDKITKGQKEHGCCACHAIIKKRKFKILTYGNPSQYFLCVKCYTNPPPELAPAFKKLEKEYKKGRARSRAYHFGCVSSVVQKAIDGVKNTPCFCKKDRKEVRELCKELMVIKKKLEGV